MKKIKIFLPLFYSGFISVITQLILTREIFAFSEGIEIFIGVCMSLWLLFFAAGVKIGNSILFRKYCTSSLVFISHSILPIISLILLWAMRIFVVPSGTMISPVMLIIIASISLLPFCLFSGIFFSVWNYKIKSEGESFKTIQLYFFDILGSIMGGILFAFLFIKHFSHFQILICNTFLSLFFLPILIKKIWKFIIVSAALMIFIALLWLYQTESHFLSYIFHGQKIIENKDTEYGKIVIANQDGQTNFYWDYCYTTSMGDSRFAEEFIHHAMLRHTNPKNILFVGIGNINVYDEIFKYPEINVTIAEPNKKLIDIYKNSGVMKKEYVDKLELFHNDITSMSNVIKKDIVFCTSSYPKNYSNNRFYTISFFEKCKELMSDSGIFIIALPAVEDYINKNLNDLNSVLFHSLKSVWKNVIIQTGSALFFIASESILSENVFPALSKKGIETKYFNEYYTDIFSLEQRNRMVKKRITSEAAMNTASNPIAVSLYQNYHFSMFGNSIIIFLIAALLMITVFLFIKVKISLRISYISGFVSFSGQFLLMLIFQTIFGSLYAAMSFFYFIYMTGAATAVFVIQKSNTTDCRRITSYFLYIALLFIMILFQLKYLSFFQEIQSLSYISLLIENFLLSYFTTAILATIVKHRVSKLSVSGNNYYSAELLGACSGALFITVFVLPKYGLSFSVMLLIFICFLGVLFSIRKTKLNQN